MLAWRGPYRGGEGMASGAQLEPTSGLIVARVAIGVTLVAVTLIVLRPFLVPAVWAAVVAFMTWTPYTWLRERTRRPQLSAALVTFVLTLLVGVPLVGLLVLVVEESITLIRHGQEWVQAGTPLPAWLTEIPLIGPRIDEFLAQPLANSEQWAPRLLELGKALSQRVVSVAGGVAQNAFAFFMTFAILFVLYLEGEPVVAHGRRLVTHLFPSRPPEYVDEVGTIVRGVVLGVLGTAAIQGAVAGVGYAIFGVPYAVGLSALTALLSFIPGGTFVATVGAAGWLLTHDQTGSAIGMAIWGVVLVGSLDSFLRPFLIKRSGSADIPFLLILFGVLGGLTAFGFLGLLFGPVLLAVVYTLVRTFPPAQPAEWAERAESQRTK